MAASNLSLAEALLGSPLSPSQTVEEVVSMRVAVSPKEGQAGKHSLIHDIGGLVDEPGASIYPYLLRDISNEVIQQLESALLQADLPSPSLAKLVDSVIANSNRETAAAQQLREVLSARIGVSGVNTESADVLSDAINAAKGFLRLADEVEAARGLQEKWVKRADAVSRLDSVLAAVRDYTYIHPLSSSSLATSNGGVGMEGGVGSPLPSIAATHVLPPCHSTDGAAARAVCSGTPDSKSLNPSDDVTSHQLGPLQAWELQTQKLETAIGEAKEANISVNKAKRLLKELQAQCLVAEAAHGLELAMAKRPSGSGNLKTALLKAESAASALAGAGGAGSAANDSIMPLILNGRRRLEVERAVELLHKASLSYRSVADLPKLETAILNARKVGAEDLDPESYRVASELRARLADASRCRAVLETSVRNLQKLQRQEDADAIETALAEANSWVDLVGSDIERSVEALNQWRVQMASEAKLKEALNGSTTSSTTLTKAIAEASAAGVKVQPARRVLKLITGLESAVAEVGSGSNTASQIATLRARLEAAEQGGVPEELGVLNKGKALLQSLTLIEVRGSLQVALASLSSAAPQQRLGLLQEAVEKAEQALGCSHLDLKALLASPPLQLRPNTAAQQNSGPSNSNTLTSTNRATQGSVSTTAATTTATKATATTTTESSSSAVTEHESSSSNSRDVESPLPSDQAPSPPAEVKTQGGEAETASPTKPGGRDVKAASNGEAASPVKPGGGAPKAASNGKDAHQVKDTAAKVIAVGPGKLKSMSGGQGGPRTKGGGGESNGGTASGAGGVSNGRAGTHADGGGRGGSRLVNGLGNAQVQAGGEEGGEELQCVLQLVRKAMQRMEVERVELARVEAAKAEAELALREKLQKEKKERERVDEERLDRERIESAEKERALSERREKQRVAEKERAAKAHKIKVEIATAMTAANTLAPGAKQARAQQQAKQQAQAPITPASHRAGLPTHAVRPPPPPSSPQKPLRDPHSLFSATTGSGSSFTPALDEFPTAAVNGVGASAAPQGLDASALASALDASGISPSGLGPLAALLNPPGPTGSMDRNNSSSMGLTSQMLQALDLDGAPFTEPPSSWHQQNGDTGGPGPSCSFSAVETKLRDPLGQGDNGSLNSTNPFTTTSAASQFSNLESSNPVTATPAASQFSNGEGQVSSITWGAGHGLQGAVWEPLKFSSNSFRSRSPAQEGPGPDTNATSTAASAISRTSKVSSIASIEEAMGGFGRGYRAPGGVAPIQPANIPHGTAAADADAVYLSHAVSLSHSIGSSSVGLEPPAVPLSDLWGAAPSLAANPSGGMPYRFGFRDLGGASWGLDGAGGGAAPSAAGGPTSTAGALPSTLFRSSVTNANVGDLGGSCWQQQQALHETSQAVPSPRASSNTSHAWSDLPDQQLADLRGLQDMRPASEGLAPQMLAQQLGVAPPAGPLTDSQLTEQLMQLIELQLGGGGGGGGGLPPLQSAQTTSALAEMPKNSSLGGGGQASDNVWSTSQPQNLQQQQAADSVWTTSQLQNRQQQQQAAETVWSSSQPQNLQQQQTSDSVWSTSQPQSLHQQQAADSVWTTSQLQNLKQQQAAETPAPTAPSGGQGPSVVAQRSQLNSQAYLFGAAFGSAAQAQVPASSGMPPLRSGGGSGGGLGPLQPRTCRYFLQGFCRDGERCRFSHATGNAAGPSKGGPGGGPGGGGRGGAYGGAMSSQQVKQGQAHQQSRLRPEAGFERWAYPNPQQHDSNGADVTLPDDLTFSPVTSPRQSFT
eukprot:gene23155-30360_t